MRAPLLLAAAALAAILTGCAGQAPADEPTTPPATSRPATTVTETAEPTHTQRPPLDPTETRDVNHPKSEIRADAEVELGHFQADRWGKAWDGLTWQSRQVISRDAWVAWMSACDFDYSGISVGRVQTGNDLAVVRWVKPDGYTDMLMRYQRDAWRLELNRGTVEYIESGVDLAAACDTAE
ncbi:MAG: hypothetical protein GEV07_03755 [Streptosporangiales bacterium]|nr:hypothetical protein [Streptosporangiales bacterium]